MIALTRSRGHRPGKAYLDKLAAAGKTRTEALRLLRRGPSDAALTAIRRRARHRTSNRPRRHRTLVAAV